MVEVVAKPVLFFFFFFVEPSSGTQPQMQDQRIPKRGVDEPEKRPPPATNGSEGPPRQKLIDGWMDGDCCAYECIQYAVGADELRMRVQEDYQTPVSSQSEPPLEADPGWSGAW